MFQNDPDQGPPGPWLWTRASGVWIPDPDISLKPMKGIIALQQVAFIAALITVAKILVI